MQGEAQCTPRAAATTHARARRRECFTLRRAGEANARSNQRTFFGEPAQA
jgi:hypothetical protein